jgi:1,4-dihydroxy-2-naphthoate octaprenyltransferase
MDQDETSIGGLKFPPKVPKTMFFITVVLDIVALISTYYYFGKKPMLLLFVYILASRAYSYRGIRLKKYPIIGYLTVCICQGILIYFLVNLSCNTLKDNNHVLNAIISFLLVGAGYPLSQVYQHESDKKDNVETISMKLGIRGTFIFSGVLFFTLFVCFVLKFLLLQYTAAKFFSFILCLFPVLLLFTQWSIAVFKDDKNANYDGTMKMNTAGAISMNLYFIFLIII